MWVNCATAHSQIWLHLTFGQRRSQKKNMQRQCWTTENKLSRNKSQCSQCQALQIRIRSWASARKSTALPYRCGVGTFNFLRYWSKRALETIISFSVCKSKIDRRTPKQWVQRNAIFNSPRSDRSSVLAALEDSKSHDQQRREWVKKRWRQCQWRTMLVPWICATRNWSAGANNFWHSFAHNHNECKLVLKRTEQLFLISTKIFSNAKRPSPSHTVVRNMWSHRDSGNEANAQNMCFPIAGKWYFKM